MIIILTSFLALILTFLAGGFAYRAGTFSMIKNLFAKPSSPTEAIPVEQPEFDFEFLTDPHPNSLNSASLINHDTPLKFILAGHIYGRPGDDQFHPSPSLLKNIALLKAQNPDFVVFLGDLVWKPSEENFDLLNLLVMDQFTVPVFNAVGNHDVTKRELYQTRYGNTVYAFRYKDHLFLVLDTTLDYYQLTTDQYDFIMSQIQDQRSRPRSSSPAYAPCATLLRRKPNHWQISAKTE